MSRRKLSRQQQRRIQKNQQQRIAHARSETLEQDCILHGLVIKHHGKKLLVENEADGRVYHCGIRQNLGSIVVGDRVVFHPLAGRADTLAGAIARDPGAGVVSALKPRHTCLQRSDGAGKTKIIAANIDQVFIIDAPPPLGAQQAYNRINTGLIDRYLIIAEKHHLQSSIVINKIDLLSTQELHRVKDMMQIYHRLGYPVLYASIRQELPQQLMDLLAQKNNIFVGQSGVGKSSLINVLLPQANARIGALSAANHKGRHTTTAAQLYHLPQQQAGGKQTNIIDSPGIRELGLWHIEQQDIIRGYQEINYFAVNCRFRNCQHNNEPGCAVQKALSEQQISMERYKNYQKILESVLS